MTHGSGSFSEPDDAGTKVRTCPHCGEKIVWKDLGGLATQAWHGDGMMITQAVVNLNGEEVDDHPLSKSEQKCLGCGAVLTESDFH